MNRPFSHVALENDGCEISSDLALSAFNGELLMLLEAGESWTSDALYAAENHTLEHDKGMLIFEDVLMYIPLKICLRILKLVGLRPIFV